MVWIDLGAERPISLRIDVLPLGSLQVAESDCSDEVLATADANPQQRDWNRKYPGCKAACLKANERQRGVNIPFMEILNMYHDLTDYRSLRF